MPVIPCQYRNSPQFIDPEGLLKCTQQTFIGPVSCQKNLVHIITFYLKIHLTINLPSPASSFKQPLSFSFLRLFFLCISLLLISCHIQHTPQHPLIRERLPSIKPLNMQFPLSSCNFLPPISILCLILCSLCKRHR